MATKAKTLQVKDKEKDDKAADAPEKDSAEAPSPLLDLSDAADKKMIKQAKKRGFVTFDQFNLVLPSDTHIARADRGHHVDALRHGHQRFRGRGRRQRGRKQGRG